MRVNATTLVFAAVVAVVVVACLYPIERTLAPDWQITVVDEKGTRLSGIDVRETWQDLSTENKRHEELLKTDARGSVRFPRRALKTNLFRVALGCWNQRRTMPTPQPCGPSASVWAFGPQLGPMDADDTAQTKAGFIYREFKPDTIVERQNSMIMLHHCPAGYSGTGCKNSDVYAPVGSAGAANQ